MAKKQISKRTKSRKGGPSPKAKGPSPHRLKSKRRKIRARRSRSGAKSISKSRLQFALRKLKSEKSLASVAHEMGITPQLLRRRAIKAKVLVRKGGKWIVQKDIPRTLLIYSDGKEFAITVSKFRTASRIGEYMAGVRWFVQTNDIRHLEPFAGKSVTDATGKRFPFETNPNVLHRLAASGGSSFEEIYRLVI